MLTGLALRGLWGSLLLALASFGPAFAQEQAGLATEGGRLAAQACADCHAVSGGKPLPGAPDFAAIARMPSTTATAIRVFLKTPHANMPNIVLTEREIDALTAYILSQGGR